MNPKHILTLIICLLTSLSTLAAQPNIVVIMADDLGWRDLHCYGNEPVDTPALDQLAKEGMLFTDAYAAAPVCSPTRAAMMTGQSPSRLHLTNHAPGNKDNFALENSNLHEPPTLRNLPLSYVTIAERLSAAGYATAHIGKWHLSYVARNNPHNLIETDLHPNHQGFDINIAGNFRGGPPSYFAPYKISTLTENFDGEYLPARIADEAIAYIQQPRDKPFFLSYWPFSVHYPMQATESLITKYKNLKAQGQPIRDPAYAAMIEAMDTHVGRFLNALDDAGLRDNTLVIFKSDNGGYNGNNKPLRGFKGMLYEGGIRIPWIVRWPGVIKPNTTSNTPIISTDCYPTLLEVANLSPTPNHPIDGQSLLPLFKQNTFDRNTLYFHYPNYAFHKKNRLGSVIREGNFKLIKRYDDNSLELYNLTTDISEKNNLATQSSKHAKRLEQKLDKWLIHTGAMMPIRTP